ncbi:glycoside hydrolase family 113 [Cyclobacterium salsum]|uniref:glycoside hydrolase family 113 n=1 Tax=Cyclobacterium salsum TaxID=2666329 RepID=UPI001F1A00D4|nr:hypothetical protein [Cyclobacterium salsum]
MSCKKRIGNHTLNLTFLVMWSLACSASKNAETLASLDGVKHRGVCWVASPNPLEGGELLALTAIGASHISQTPFGWQSQVQDPELRWEAHTDKMWWGESLNGLKATLDSARALGLSSMLKPHLWVRGSWPGEISMKSEADWQTWFRNYKAFILYYAHFAEENGMPLLCVGTELEKTSHREADWRGIIKAVREVYSGKLTYAANFTEYEKVAFWDDLDYIGVQAYFPLAMGAEPGLTRLNKGWQNVVPTLEKVSREFQKPILFTELGYCDTHDAAQEPWLWPNQRKEVPISQEMQARCYQAFFEAVWDKPWFQGVYFWKWYPKSRERVPDFTPQNKLAQGVMKTFFLGNGTQGKENR